MAKKLIWKTSKIPVQRATMHHDTMPCALPALISDSLRSSYCLVDNVFADVWKTVGMAGLLGHCGFQKPSGVAVNEVMYALALWVWLKYDLRKNKRSVTRWKDANLKKQSTAGITRAIV